MTVEQQLQQYVDWVSAQSEPIELTDVLYERSGTGPVRPLVDRPAPRIRPGWRHATAAAAAVVLALLGAWLLIDWGSDQPDVGSEPADVARAFIELGHAGDTASALELVASGVRMGSGHEEEPWWLLGGYPPPRQTAVTHLDVSEQRRVLEGLLLLEGLLGGTVEEVDCESADFTVDQDAPLAPDDADSGTYCSIRVSNPLMLGEDGPHPWFVVVRSGKIRYVDPHAPFSMGWLYNAIIDAGLTEQHRAACNHNGEPLDGHKPLSDKQDPPGLGPDPVALARSCGSFIAEHMSDLLSLAPPSDTASPPKTAERFFQAAISGDFSTALSNVSQVRSL